MRPSRATQSLSYPIRLPDAVQADALRLLDVSREVINATVVALWPQLDEFGARQTRYAYKQVSAMIGSSNPHGDRQWPYLTWTGATQEAICPDPSSTRSWHD
jgi:putative transposase